MYIKGEGLSLAAKPLSMSIPRSFSHDFITAVMWVYQKFVCD